ncbi:OmpA family protein [Mucilaginibacter sp. HMF5004]|uniref:OmpA family protein n=1 Tax=Mucilaginibacter rivuli TaxID=2857527 RepID=UPI001C5E5F18|nr:OmpA family protein [Mucilaginibacter rivuli]MBW4889758.1 OmpA family protein [Mucilaginibacter rivuli]
MLPINKLIKKSIAACLLMVIAYTTAQAQNTQPTWWFGVSGAANFNFYDGTTQRLNDNLIVPAAFHKGTGIRPYGSVLVEYRPLGILGVSLNVAYDGRGGKFKEVVAPCNCPADLEVNASYIAIEPSLRLGIPKTGLYFFAGPRVAFNINNSFEYTQLKQPNTNANLSNINKTIFSGQAGVGYDFLVSSPKSATKIDLSPFVSYQPYFGQDPRSIESWSMTTVRVGIALKFGKGSKAVAKQTPSSVALPVREVVFTVRAPISIPAKRQVSETLPLRNSVFFDDGSSDIPVRYVMLSTSQASSFREHELQSEQSVSTTGRSSRQLNVYHNILNILGDRLRSNPDAVITLTGASGRGIVDGKAMAESIKRYLVVNFGIDGNRITTVGRIKPVVASEQPGGNKELVLLRAGDRRVDIESSSPALLLEVGGGMMKPVQIVATQVDPMDSQVILNVDGAKDLLQSWSVDITDDKGISQHYGPYTTDQQGIAGTHIVGARPEGDYKITMIGITKSGLSVKKESSVHLVRNDNVVVKGYRYSILFDFDKSNAIASYEKFLTGTVAASIIDGSTVIIHGHTDIIGEEDHNMKLSQQRAAEVQTILEHALVASGKTHVKFETLGFGEDASHAPFDNSLPEERFYNRTVIVDIIPIK